MDKRVLIAPLDWGLGHATRCMPIIQYLVASGHEPIICADGRMADLLRAEFPTLPFQHLNGYHIEYPRGAGMVWKMAVSTPRILRRIKDETTELAQLVRQWKPDAVISDNRFGFHHPEVPSVYMTHQVMIKAPFAEGIVHHLHQRFMTRFHHCWVPDMAEAPGISGELGHHYTLPPNGRFIGPISRFNRPAHVGGGGLVAVLSGPEPQRTIFEELVIQQVAKLPISATIVCGRPDLQFDRTTAQGHRIVSHLPATELEKVMAAADVVLSRSGYSTVMDLAVLGRKAIFVPTPGQTEQEYLATFYDQRGIHLRMPQHAFDLATALQRVSEYTGQGPVDATGFRSAVDGLLAQ